MTTRATLPIFVRIETVIKSFFCLILSVLFFLTALSATLIQLENPTFLVDQAQKIDLYGKVSSRLEDLNIGDIAKGSTLSKKDISEILTYSIDGKTFYSALSDSSAAYLNYLTGKTDNINLNIDLKAVKDRAQEKAIARFQSNYDNLPACQPKDIPKWTFDSTCKLPAGTLSDADLARYGRSQSDKVLKDIPDAITVDHPSEALINGRQTMLSVNKVIHTIWLITGIIALLFLALYRKGSFGTFAVSLILSGLLLLAFSLIGWDYLGKTLADLLQGTAKQMSSWSILGIEIGTQLLNTLKTYVGNISIGMLGVAAALIIISIVSRFKKPI